MITKPRYHYRTDTVVITVDVTRGTLHTLKEVFMEMILGMCLMTAKVLNTRIIRLYPSVGQGGSAFKELRFATTFSFCANDQQ
jgi:hypothetical protein